MLPLVLVRARCGVASRIVCLIVVVSFGIFVIDQTGSASTHQQEAGERDEWRSVVHGRSARAGGRSAQSDRRSRRQAHLALLRDHRGLHQPVGDPRGGHRDGAARLRVGLGFLARCRCAQGVAGRTQQSVSSTRPPASRSAPTRRSPGRPGSAPAGSRGWRRTSALRGSRGSRSRG